MVAPANRNKNTANTSKADYRPPNNHSLSTGLRAVPQTGNTVNKTGGRSDGMDVNRQPAGKTNRLSDTYPSITSKGEAKPSNPEVQGGIPRGYVSNDNQPKGSLQDVGSKRPDGSDRVTFGGGLYEGYGDENGGYQPDPRNIVGGSSTSGPGGAGV